MTAALALALVGVYFATAAVAARRAGEESSVQRELLQHWFAHPYTGLPRDVVDALGSPGLRALVARNRDWTLRWASARDDVERDLAARGADDEDAEQAWEAFEARAATQPAAALSLINTALLDNPARERAFYEALGETAHADRMAAQRTQSDLAEQLRRARHGSPWRRFGYTPTEPTPHGLFAHAFLHRTGSGLVVSVLLLVFLGVAVEARWGRTWLLAVFLIGAAAAATAYGVARAGEDVPLLGAGGALAGLAGAFLGCLDRRRIRYGWVTWLVVRPPVVREVEAPALLVPLAFLGVVLALGLDPATVVGGLFGGVAVAVVLRLSGIDARRAAGAGEARAAATASRAAGGAAGDAVAEGRAKLARGLHAAAAAAFRRVLATTPDDLAAHEGLLDVHRASGNRAEELTQVVALLALYARGGQGEAAQKLWAETRARIGADEMGATHIMSAAAHLGGAGDWAAAAALYLDVAQTWPEDPAAGEALVRYGRVCLEHLDQPRNAVEALELALPRVEGRRVWETEARRHLSRARAMMESESYELDTVSQNDSIPIRLKGRRYRAWQATLTGILASGLGYRAQDGTVATCPWREIKALAFGRVGERLLLDVVVDVVEDERSVEVRALRIDAERVDFEALLVTRPGALAADLAMLIETMVHQNRAIAVVGELGDLGGGRVREFDDAAGYEAWLFGKLLGQLFGAGSNTQPTAAPPG